MSKRINKSHIWIFIICLIIITANVLLITGFVQIKYNKTLSLKDNDISDDKSNIIKENNDLRNTIDILKEDLARQKEETTEAEKRYKTAKDNNASILNMYEDLIKAELLRQKGDLIGSAASIKSVNSDYLQVNASELENKVKSDVIKPAAEYYYKAGYEDFIKGSYEHAIYEFKKSLFFTQDEDFKDDSIFYLGESYYQSGNKEMAKITAKHLIDNFPESKYVNEAEKLYAIIN